MSSSTFSLARAASDGDAGAVRSLLAEGADVNEAIQGGQTPLIRAVIGGHADIVRLLIDAGADVRLKDRVGLTAGDWSERRGFWALGQLLSDAAAANAARPLVEETDQPSSQDAAESEAGPQAFSAAAAIQPEQETVGLANRQNETMGTGSVWESDTGASPVNHAQDERATGNVHQYETTHGPEHARIEQPGRESVPSAENKQAKNDRKWIEGLQRIMSDLDRGPQRSSPARVVEGYRKEAALRQSAVESKPAPVPSVGDEADEPRETTARPKRRATEEKEVRTLGEEATIALEQDNLPVETGLKETEAEPKPVRVSELLQEPAIDQNAGSQADEQSETTVGAEHREPEESRPQIELEAALPTEGAAQSPVKEPIETTSGPKRSEVEEPIQQSVTEARNATVQTIGIYAERQSDASARSKRRELEPRTAREASRESVTDAMPAVEQDVGSPAVELTDLKTDQDRRQREVAPPSEAEPERVTARKENALTLEESRRRVEEDALRRLQEETLRKSLRETRGVKPAKSSGDSSTPAVVAFEATPRELSNPATWARPTLWVLVGITLLASTLVTYLLISRPSESETPSAPAAVETPMAPAEIKKLSPVVGGALSGMEVNVPEPEYPSRAKSEGVSGTVMVRVQVNKKGRVVSARSSKGDWRLRAAAVKAAQKATFSPEKLARERRVVAGTITYNFVAQTESASASGSQAAVQTNAPSAGSSSANGSSVANAGDYPVVGGMLVGAEKNLPQPDYPEKARSKGISGAVTIVVRVNRAGRVTSLRTIKGDSQLRAAALKAARKATFSPEKLFGKGEVVGTITYNFKP